jgi:hypothetical protein
MILENDNIIEFEMNYLTNTVLDSKTGYSMKLASKPNSNASFKGFLIRLEALSGQDISTALTGTSDVSQFSVVSCDANVEAITHKNNDSKTSIPFELYFEEEGNYLLEVTVVVSNKIGERNNWYYSSYDITVTPSSLITEKPSAAPSTIPSVTSSATPSVTSSVTPSVTSSATPSVTSSVTPSINSSATPSINSSATPSINSSATPSINSSATPSITSSATPTLTPSTTPSVTSSATPSITSSNVPSISPSTGPTLSPIVSPTIPATKTHAPTICEMNFSLALNTDNYGEEISWEIAYHETREVVASSSSNDGSYPSSTSIIENGCIPFNCYIFTIRDSFGDGLCCGQGNGSYWLYVNDRYVGSGGDFGTKDTVLFGTCRQIS